MCLLGILTILDIKKITKVYVREIDKKNNPMSLSVKGPLGGRGVTGSLLDREINALVGENPNTTVLPSLVALRLA